jgi:transposase
MRALKLRPLTDAEWKVTEKLAVSRTAPAIQVKRAQLLKHLAQGASAPQAAALVGSASAEMARRLLKRFNQVGLKALEDQPRSGRKPTLTEQQRGRLARLAQSPPKADLPEARGACHWTLDTLLEAAHQEGIPVGRTRLWEILQQEGVRWWQRGRTWLGSADPEYPEKRGRSLASIPLQWRGAR